MNIKNVYPGVVFLSSLSVFFCLPASANWADEFLKGKIEMEKKDYEKSRVSLYKALRSIQEEMQTVDQTTFFLRYQDTYKELAKIERILGNHIRAYDHEEMAEFVGRNELLINLAQTTTKPMEVDEEGSKPKTTTKPMEVESKTNMISNESSASSNSDTNRSQRAGDGDTIAQPENPLLLKLLEMKLSAIGFTEKALEKSKQEKSERNFTSAEQYLLWGLEFGNPNDLRTLIRLAASYRQKRKWNYAEGLYRTVLRMEESDLEDHDRPFLDRHRATATIGLGLCGIDAKENIAEGLALARKLRDESFEASLLLEMGNHLRARGDNKAAMDYLTIAKRLNSGKLKESIELAYDIAKRYFDREKTR